MFTIGIYGSAGKEGPEIEKIAERTGLALGGRQCVLVTGACSGLPYIAARAAVRSGGNRLLGFSPMHDRDGQRRFTPHDDLSIYTRLHFLPEGLSSAEDIEVAKKYRNVASTARCDAGIILAGGWGTLHEVCSLIAYGKIVAPVRGTGGIAAELPTLFDAIGAETGGTVLPPADPEELVRLLFDALERRKKEDA